jgi:hypothetical protein
MENRNTGDNNKCIPNCKICCGSGRYWTGEEHEECPNSIYTVVDLFPNNDFIDEDDLKYPYLTPDDVINDNITDNGKSKRHKKRNKKT